MRRPKNKPFSEHENSLQTLIWRNNELWTITTTTTREEKNEAREIKREKNKTSSKFKVRIWTTINGKYLHVKNRFLFLLFVIDLTDDQWGCLHSSIAFLSGLHTTIRIESERFVHFQSKNKKKLKQSEPKSRKKKKKMCGHFFSTVLWRKCFSNSNYDRWIMRSFLWSNWNKQLFRSILRLNNLTIKLNFGVLSSKPKSINNRSREQSRVCVDEEIVPKSAHRAQLNDLLEFIYVYFYVSYKSVASKLTHTMLWIENKWRSYRDQTKQHRSSFRYLPNQITSIFFSKVFLASISIPFKMNVSPERASKWNGEENRYYFFLFYFVQ